MTALRTVGGSGRPTRAAVLGARQRQARRGRAVAAGAGLCCFKLCRLWQQRVDAENPTTGVKIFLFFRTRDPRNARNVDSSGPGEEWICAETTCLARLRAHRSSCLSAGRGCQLLVGLGLTVTVQSSECTARVRVLCTADSWRGPRPLGWRGRRRREGSLSISR